MNIKRLIAIALVAFVLVASTAAANPDPSKTRRSDGTEQRIGYQYPMPASENPVASFSMIATPTLTVGASVPVKLGDLSDTTDPTRAIKAVRVGSLNGILNFGNASITTAVSPFSIASGSFREFAIDTNTPAVYVISETGTQTVPLQSW